MKPATRKVIDNSSFIYSIYYQHSAYIKLKKKENKTFHNKLLFSQYKISTFVMLAKTYSKVDVRKYGLLSELLVSKMRR